MKKKISIGRNSSSGSFVINERPSSLIESQFPSFKKDAKIFTDQGTSSVKEAKRILVSSGILTRSGKLSSKYK